MKSLQDNNSAASKISLSKNRHKVSLMGVGEHVDAYLTGSLVLARYWVHSAGRVSLQMGKNK